MSLSGPGGPCWSRGFPVRPRPHSPRPAAARAPEAPRHSAADAAGKAGGGGCGWERAAVAYAVRHGRAAKATPTGRGPALADGAKGGDGGGERSGHASRLGGRGRGLLCGGVGSGGRGPKRRGAGLLCLVCPRGLSPPPAVTSPGPDPPPPRGLPPLGAWLSPPPGPVTPLWQALCPPGPGCHLPGACHPLLGRVPPTQSPIPPPCGGSGGPYGEGATSRATSATSLY